MDFHIHSCVAILFYLTDNYPIQHYNAEIVVDYPIVFRPTHLIHPKWKSAFDSLRLLLISCSSKEFQMTSRHDKCINNLDFTLLDKLCSWLSSFDFKRSRKYSTLQISTFSPSFKHRGRFISTIMWFFKHKASLGICSTSNLIRRSAVLVADWNCASTSISNGLTLDAFSPLPATMVAIVVSNSFFPIQKQVTSS